jgi:hypothetical protein
MLHSALRHGDQYRSKNGHTCLYTLLDTIPKNWYLELEVHRETTDWEELTHNFKVTFSFEDEAPSVDTTLQVIKDKIFASEDSIELVPVCSAHRSSVTVREVLECYNVIGEDQEDEDLRNLQIPKTEGEHTVEGPELESVVYAKPLRTCKVNIGIEDKPKFVNIGDYWNEETVENIVDLLRISRSVSNYIFRDERDCWRIRRDEDPFETRC